MEYFVCIPAGTAAGLGSLEAAGMVASEQPGGRLLVHYEPPSPAENIRTWADRVYHAYDRMRAHNATHKMLSLDMSEVVRVGRFDDRFGEVVLDGPEERLALKRFLGSAADLDVELVAEGTTHFQPIRRTRDLMRSPDPAAREQAQQLIHFYDIDL